MIVNHATGARANLRDILRTFCLIVADGSERIGQMVNGSGFRARWMDTTNPTDAELRSVGCSIVVETEQPTPGEGEYVQPGPLELVNDSWQKTWVIAPVPAPSVPDEVSALSLELVLIANGLNGPVDAYVETLAPEAKVRWKRRTTMRRDSQDIENGRIALGLSPQQVDALFIAADAWEE